MRFQIVQKGPRTFIVYGFKNEQTLGESYGRFRSWKLANDKLTELEEFYNKRK